uniref:Complement C1q tumor necrosis factor-related protein 1 n=1 Tax=Sus scrofa TaxID=9823 RepID=A0A480HII2_PIG
MWGGAGRLAGAGAAQGWQVLDRGGGHQAGGRGRAGGRGEAAGQEVRGRLGLGGGLDQVAAEGDVGVELVAEDGVLALALEEAHPHLVLVPQLQHQALALHDAAVAHLRVQDHHLLRVLHDVQVRLLLVPGVHVEAEEVDAGHVAVELPGEHVEVAVEVHELRVEDHRLVVVVAVQRLLPAHREGGVVVLAPVPGGPHGPLLPLGSRVAPGACRACFAVLALQAPVAAVALLTFQYGDVDLWHRDGLVHGSARVTAAEAPGSRGLLALKGAVRLTLFFSPLSAVQRRLLGPLLPPGRTAQHRAAGEGQQQTACQRESQPTGAHLPGEPSSHQRPGAGRPRPPTASLTASPSGAASSRPGRGTTRRAAAGEQAEGKRLRKGGRGAGATAGPCRRHLDLPRSKVSLTRSGNAVSRK